MSFVPTSTTVLDPWTRILGALEKKVNRQSFNTFLKPTRMSHLNGRVLFVRIPSADFQHVGDRYGDLIQEAIDKLELELDDGDREMAHPRWAARTQDAEQALGYLKRFGSVTVLNGHIHQTLKKVEGNVTFHTATSTAFPQPGPGTAPKPGPMKVAPEILPTVLGITEVNYVESSHSLAVVDSKLG